MGREYKRESRTRVFPYKCHYCPESDNRANITTLAGDANDKVAFGFGTKDGQVTVYTRCSRPARLVPENPQSYQQAAELQLLQRGNPTGRICQRSLQLVRDLSSKGFNMRFQWLPNRVGIRGLCSTTSGKLAEGRNKSVPRTIQSSLV